MWTNRATCYYKLDINAEYKNMCVFDLDDTIVKLRTNILLNKNVKSVLKELSNHSNIVVFSNQSGIEKSHTTHYIVQSIMDSVSKQINIPISFFYAISDDIYRKPMIGMYELFNELLSNLK